MRVWVDLFSGDEMVTDSYKQYGNIQEVEGEDSPVYDYLKHPIMRVQAKMENKTEGKVDVGAGNAFGGAEEDEAPEEGVSVNNVVDACNLQELTLSKKDFMATIKPLLKRTVEHMKEKSKTEEQVKAFQKAATDVIKFVVAKYDEFQIFCGESFDTEASLAFCYFPDGESEPTFLFLTDCYKMKKL